jgi:hypothetical protein
MAEVPAAAWASRASRVASMPDSFSCRSAWARPVRSVTVTGRVMTGSPVAAGMPARRW